MAVADLTTGKIIGCEEGSYTWWHEKGHFVFNNADKGIRYNYYFQFMMMVAVVIIPFNFFIDSYYLKIYTMIVSLTVLYFYAYEEIWCWDYSLKQKGNKWRDVPWLIFRN